jgi:hypothetical protein
MITTVLALLLISQLPPAMCPGIEAPVVSPDGRWAVECQLKPDNEPEQAHKLFLRDRRSETRQELRSFDRWTRIFWSPDSAWLPITDGEGSNVSNAFVYRPGTFPEPRDVFDLLKRQVPASKLQFLQGRDHVYLEVSGWADSKHLKVRLWGHGDGAAFERRFTVVIADR